jgi:hypothetical protein
MAPTHDAVCYVVLLGHSCSYITRRAKEEFHALAKGTDTAAAEAAWQRAQSQLDVWKRQSLVYGLYARKVKNVMVSPFSAAAVAAVLPSDGIAAAARPVVQTMRSPCGVWSRTGYAGGVV